MRLDEIKQSKSDLQELADACNAWVALEHSPQQIKFILSHPYSQNFKTISKSEIYRCAFYPYKKFQKTGIAKIKPQPEGFIAYSLRPDWGSTARSDFDYSGDILLFRKKVNGGVILNFTALLQALGRQGLQVEQIDEAEVWMEGNPYYTTFSQNEFIDAELSDGKTISGKVSQATINQFKKWVITYKMDPEQAAKDLGIPAEMIPQLMS